MKKIESYYLKNNCWKTVLRKLRGRSFNSSPIIEREQPSTSDESFRLLDHGDGYKLEAFGKYIVQRPSKISQRRKRMALPLWGKADFQFIIDSKTNTSKWENLEGKEWNDWIVQFDHMRFQLSPFEGGQVGIFPEQARQWKWMSSKVYEYFQENNHEKDTMNILNCFGYTGGSTLACLVHPNVVVSCQNKGSCVSLISSPIDRLLM